MQKNCIQGCKLICLKGCKQWGNETETDAALLNCTYENGTSFEPKPDHLIAKGAKCELYCKVNFYIFCRFPSLPGRLARRRGDSRKISKNTIALLRNQGFPFARMRRKSISLLKGAFFHIRASKWSPEEGSETSLGALGWLSRCSWALLGRS